MTSLSEKPFPTYIYKILAEAPPQPLPHALELSPLDAKDGFIHMSIANRIPETASLFFSKASSIWLLKVSTEKVQEDAKLIWEGPEGCCHIYGKEKGGWGRLGEGIVADVRECIRTEKLTWNEALAGVQSTWLVDN